MSIAVNGKPAAVAADAGHLGAHRTHAGKQAMKSPCGCRWRCAPFRSIVSIPTASPSSTAPWCSRRTKPAAAGRSRWNTGARLESRLVCDSVPLRFNLVDTAPERHRRWLEPLYRFPGFWPYWVYFDLKAPPLY